MTRLSVNVNKIATLRNARGGDNPNLVQVVKDCEKYGAEGITVHPRNDERHVTMKDVYDIASIVKTDFNIEGYPDKRFLKIINDIVPDQVTLVPDPPEVLTSNIGWRKSDLDVDLKGIINDIKKLGSKVVIFIDPDVEMIDYAKEIGSDRIELYTGTYAKEYLKNREGSVIDYVNASNYAKEIGIEVNAGHDLDLNNLRYLKQSIPHIYEVSIGHALVCDAIYLGLENTIKSYLNCLR
ncbi:MAG: pyridoxine 5'-phosphate synthase [Cytophagales bacterium]